MNKIEKSNEKFIIDILFNNEEYFSLVDELTLHNLDAYFIF